MIKTHDIPVKQERVEVLHNGGFGVQYLNLDLRRF